jgi:tetratricopeptide (TPR) repeat protein
MSSVIDELERLSTLHEKGALSDEEVAAAKQRVLSDGPEEDSDKERELALAKAEQLMELGKIELVQGKYDEALRCFTGALHIFQNHRNRTGEESVIRDLGNVYRTQGQYERAIEFFTQALEIAREIGNKRGEGIHLGSLGNVYQAQGQYERAIEIYTQALDIAREIGDKRSEGVHLGHLGNVYRIQGQYERAIEFYTQALEIAREIGNKLSEGINLGNFGDALFNLERLDEAESVWRQAILIGDETMPGAAGAFRGSLAWLLARQDQIVEARSMLETGELQVTSDPEEHAKFLAKKGQVCHLAGDADGARASLEQAQALAAELTVGGETEVGQVIRELETVLGEG